MLSGDRIFNALQFLDTVKSILLNNGLLFLSKKSLLSCLLTEAFAVIRRGVTIFYKTKKHVEGVVPRDCQIVASLLFCQDLSAQGGASHGTKRMQQISTGEGKTMILCMVAIFKVLCGEKVDIVTNSSVLATRDATEQKSLYNSFKISVSHCCHEDLLKRREAYKSISLYMGIYWKLSEGYLRNTLLRPRNSNKVTIL